MTIILLRWKPKKTSEEIIEKLKHDDIEYMQKKIVESEKSIKDVKSKERESETKQCVFAFAIKRKIACFSTQKKYAQIMLKMESAQKGIAGKDILKNVDISRKGFVEEINPANIFMRKLIKNKIATNVKKLLDKLIIVKFVVKPLVLSAQLKKHKLQTSVKLMKGKG